MIVQCSYCGKSATPLHLRGKEKKMTRKQIAKLISQGKCPPLSGTIPDVHKGCKFLLDDHCVLGHPPMIFQMGHFGCAIGCLDFERKRDSTIKEAD